jgi:hypothetical protein
MFPSIRFSFFLLRFSSSIIKNKRRNSIYARKPAIHPPFEHKIFPVILEAALEGASVFSQTLFKPSVACVTAALALPTARGVADFFILFTVGDNKSLYCLKFLPVQIPNRLESYLELK